MVRLVGAHVAHMSISLRMKVKLVVLQPNLGSMTIVALVTFMRLGVLDKGKKELC